MWGGGLVLTALLLACAAAGVASAALQEVFSWRQLDYAWPSKAARALALETGAYRPDANAPVGLEVWRDRVFVTVPRWRPGVPASLNVFALNGSGASPALRPYPDWESHNVSAEGWSARRSRLVSPVRVRADSCDRLWVLDPGAADLLEAPQKLANAALLVFDLRTDTLLRRFDLPRALLRDSSFLVNVAVEVPPAGCEHAFAYVADMGSYALLVYSWAGDHAWRVSHNFFLSNPLEGEFSVHGERFQWADGVFGLALSKPNRLGHRTLYFHAFASTSEFQVSTDILQNETRAQDSYHEFHRVGSRGPNSQAGASFMDEESAIVFYTQVNQDAVTCWNSRTRPHYMPSTIGLVDRSNRTLVFPNDIKVDAQRNLWVLSDRLPLYFFGHLDPNDTNFRILRAPVDEAVRGSICDPHYSGPEPALEDDPLADRIAGRGGERQACGSSSGAAPAAAVAAATLSLLLLVPVRPGRA